MKLMRQNQLMRHNQLDHTIPYSNINKTAFK